MSGSFIISPLNSLTFKKKDSLLPSYNNTLDRYDDYENSIVMDFNQKFLETDTIIIQMRTNYATVTAKLYGSDDSPVNLTVTEASSYTDFSFYEISLSGLSVDKYRIHIFGTDLTFGNVEFVCEPFEIVTSLSKMYKKVVYYNDENSFYIDYSTGIQHFFYIPAVVFKIQPKGEIDVYNNLDNEEKLEEVNFRVYEFQSKEVARHLAIKFSEACSMDNLIINDVEFVTNEKPELQYNGNLNLLYIVSNLTERYTVGVNSDDVGFTGISLESQEGLVMNIGEENISGSNQYSIDEGYAIRFITMRLTAGASATVNVGTTPAGSDILSGIVLSTLNAPIDIDRSKLIDWDGTGTVYVTVTGAGATIDYWMTAISFKSITV